MFDCFKRTRDALDYLQENGADRNKIDIISFGDNGCYLFYVGKDGNLHRRSLSRIGISYVSKDELLDMAQEEGIL